MSESTNAERLAALDALLKGSSTPPVVEEMPEEWGPDIMHDLINSFDTAHDDYKPQARRHLERFIEYWAKKPAELQNEVEWLKSALQSSQQRAEQMVLDEREACAKIAEEYIDAVVSIRGPSTIAAIAHMTAHHIRARSIQRTET